MKLSIIIVSWNVRELLVQNLAQLGSLMRPDFPLEVFVVDNASNDGTTKMVRERFAWVHLMINDWNAGFAKAVNQALHLAKGDAILLLNPDMRVGNFVLDATYKMLMEDMTIGVLGVQLRDDKGEIVRSVRRDPKPLDQLAILFKLPHLFKKIVNKYLAKDVDLTQSQDAEQVRGSFFAFRRELTASIGFFDERFFLWFEEVDFCKRVRKAGLRVRYRADLVCTDFVGRSFAQVSVWRKQRIFATSMMKYLWKWRFNW